MKKSIKFSVYLMLLALMIQLFPQQTMAVHHLDDSENESEEFILFAESAGEKAEVYEDADRSKVVGEIEDESLVYLLNEDKDEKLSLIFYKDETGSDDIEIIGYVESHLLVPVSEADEFRKNREAEEKQNDRDQEESLESDSQQEDEVTPEETDPENMEDGSAVPEDESTIDDISKETYDAADEFKDNENDGELTEENAGESVGRAKESSESIQRTAMSTFSLPKASEEILNGVALKKTTHVYDINNQDKILKTYKQGHILKFRPYSSSLFAATVFIQGEKFDGLIHKDDVDLLVDPKTIQGFASADPVRVYSAPDRQSSTLKSYKVNSVLKYQAFSSQWYKATVFINGKAHNGYIHVDDVGSNINTSVKLKGIAKKNPTNVYASQSTSSKALKSYPQGHMLIYSPYNANWHMATVYVNGKSHTGYIHASDVETAQTGAALRGIAKQAPTRVYSRASTNSPVLKSYNQGHILSYRELSNEWYEATVYINNQKKTGYIHKNHVENVSAKQITIRGGAIKQPTRVYATAFTGSKVLKSYSFGHGLVYKSFSNDWHEATVYVNGKKQTGYIHKNDVLSLTGKRIVLDPGHGGHDPGAQAQGLVEKTLNLDIALRAQTLLKNAGATVIMTRTTDVFVSLQDRAGIANRSGADIFVSIHGNSFNGTANGVETFWYGKYERQNSIRLAHSLQDRLVPALGLSYRRVAEGNFHVIRETQIPSALVEVGFLDHPGDAAKLRTATYRQRAAEGILMGIHDYF